MAHPKKRMSSTRSGNRRRNIGVDAPAGTVCPNCKSVILQHTACPTCGQYRGRKVISV